MLEPCPFCDARLEVVESWARSFSPPKLYIEYHHPRGTFCMIKGLLWSGEKGSEAGFLDMWNRRTPPASQSDEPPQEWIYAAKAASARLQQAFDEDDRKTASQSDEALVEALAEAVSACDAVVLNQWDSAPRSSASLPRPMSMGAA